MSDPFHSSKLSITRAKHHISDLKRQIAEFFKTTPYERVCETDANRTQNIYKLKLVKPMPPGLESIAFDAVSNLRSALDQAMFALVGNFCYFPIANSLTEFDRVMDGVRKKIPQEIADLLCRFKPYKGGDDPIWALNKLSNTNKHGILAPVAICTSGVQYNNFDFFGPGELIVGFPVWDRTKNEMELLRCSPGATVEADLGITTHIAICDVETLDGQPVQESSSYLRTKSRASLWLSKRRPSELASLLSSFNQLPLRSER